MTDGDGTALRRCVGDVDRFRHEHWARRVLLRRRAGSEGFDDLLALADVDELLATTLVRRPAFRLVRDGSPLDPKTYTKRIRLGSQVLDDVADVGRVHTHFAAGATIVLQGLQRQWPPLTRFCRDVERTLGHPVQANAYVTPAGAQGLGLHADAHDVFLLQVFGSKHWAVWEPDAPAADPGPAALDTELHPGDSLYLPKGARHSARTMDTASIHITVGLLSTTWADLVRTIVERAIGELDLDGPLPLGYVADDGFPKELVARLADLRHHLDEVDTEAAWRAARARFVAGRTPTLTGGLAAVIDPPTVGDATVLVRRRGALADLVPGPERVSLVLGDRTLRLPAALEPALRLVLSTPRVSATDLDGLLEPASRLVLLRRLVREGLLEVAPADQ